MLLTLLEGEVCVLELKESGLLSVYRNFRDCPEGTLADIAVCKKGEGISVRLDVCMTDRIAMLIANHGDVMLETQAQAQVAAFMGRSDKPDPLADYLIKNSKGE